MYCELWLCHMPVSRRDVRAQYPLLMALALALALALIKTEYWDRAGGGGNISYER